MASKLCGRVKSQIVNLSKEGLSQHQMMAGFKVSKGAVQGTLKLFAESELVSKHESKSKHDQANQSGRNITRSIHQA